MELKTLDAILSEYQQALAGESAPEEAISRFREFLVEHAGLARLDIPGRGPRIVAPAESLRCFHFSQYLEWYLPEKRGAAEGEVEAARASLGRLNAWLLESGRIDRDTFEENRESIRGGGEGPPVFQEIAPGEEVEPRAPSVAEERDFYVPGEYGAVISGEFLLTRVQEGILYGKREGDVREIGPILVDRAVSSGSRVGDRIHLSAGQAGDHWNLLTIGRLRE